jgi:uncharacterized integral membrane protein
MKLSWQSLTYWQKGGIIGAAIHLSISCLLWIYAILSYLDFIFHNPDAGEGAILGTLVLGMPATWFVNYVDRNIPQWLAIPFGYPLLVILLGTIQYLVVGGVIGYFVGGIRYIAARIKRNDQHDR